MSLDWDALRQQSLQPNGFAEERLRLWAQLLDVEQPISDVKEEELAPHPDERQISLDTSRSFVIYPPDPSPDLQASLLDLLVSVLRRHPDWGYYQGLHDIAGVMMLTLPPELQVVCVENFCGQRLRDAMGKGLEPIIGHLR